MKIFPWLAVTALLVPFAAAGCSTSDDDASSAAGGTTTVTGSVGNLSIAAQSAIAIYAPLQSSVGELIDGLIIDIADKDDSCTVFHTASTTILSLTFPSSPAAGTFTVINAETATPASSQVEVDISGSTATCADNGESATATGGTVTLTSVSASAVSGTFDVTFAAGSLKGTFTAPVCPATTDDGGNEDGTEPPAPPETRSEGTMNDYIFFMHDDGVATSDADWAGYLAKLRSTGRFDGGSSIGAGQCVSKTGATTPVAAHLTGYIRVRAESLDDARQLVEGNPVYEGGGTVEIRELPATEAQKERSPGTVRSRGFLHGFSVRVVSG